MYEPNQDQLQFKELFLAFYYIPQFQWSYVIQWSEDFGTFADDKMYFTGLIVYVIWKIYADSGKKPSCKSLQGFCVALS